MMALVFQPHDLLWVTDLDDDDTLPEWFDRQDLQLRPVVVRREPTPVGRIAVGLRGSNRSQRHASYVNAASVLRVLTPEQIVNQQRWHDRNAVHPLPHWATLSQVAQVMAQAHLSWGITGSLGFELATGINTANHHSDIDLRIVSATPLNRDACRDIALQLTQREQRPDIQIETPYGAFAMSEWVVGEGRVLVKSQQGPYLTHTPWQPHY
ncbi:hypothetical protein AMR76_12260 [Vibrio furnissii]|uniref:Phosphoribosyl-dephospho-CoA transferase n=1 Tax=Vibrio furnissii TaxID=29494 RepID=A0A0Q2UZY4_VIBFU|nr:malonate decarboxylase holo-ACP synthase [Vibrio furnissii]KQH86040.1 hypothetical protein AMR76_12260 [Vibrio furnissii]